MSRLTLIAAGLVLALTAPAIAQTAPPEGTDWKAKLIAAIEAHDCAMTEAEAPFQLEPLGFESDWTPTIVAELMQEGLVELRESDGALVLKTENCT